MVVESVHLEADAYMVCLTHALSTEREEVMGLLIGEVIKGNAVVTYFLCVSADQLETGHA